MKNRGMQLSRHRKQRTSRNLGKATSNESRDQEPKEKYLKGENFEPVVRGDIKRLPCISGIIKMREKMNLRALGSCTWLPHKNEQPFISEQHYCRLGSERKKAFSIKSFVF